MNCHNISRLSCSMLRGKVFNDPIHGHITIHPLSVAIIDTPHFQRLRDISQLGGVYYVFSGAASKRFEHSLGVSYLARFFVESLKHNQPDLDITPADMLCVEIAGLIHDLGHGPFSHMYDARFLKAMGTAPHFEHEHASIGIFDILIAENDLMPTFRKHGLDEADVHFIKELVLGDRSEAPPSFEWKGRGDKTFLYDIVANKRNGIDVDKFDYFARDCHVLGVTKSFDFFRLMRFARVERVNRSNSKHPFVSSEDVNKSLSFNDLEALKEESASPSSVEGSLEVCFHIKEAWNIHELFHTRYALHKRAYQHRVATAVELMISEVLVLADPYILLPSSTGPPKRMSECPHDLTAYWRMGEYILKSIENSIEQKLQPARELIHRLRSRDLFSFVGEVLFSSPEGPENASFGEVFRGNSNHVKANIFSSLQALGYADEIASDDVMCVVLKLGYGKGGLNPVTELTTFFKPQSSERENPDGIDGEEKAVVVGVVFPQAVSRLIPQVRIADNKVFFSYPNLAHLR